MVFPVVVFPAVVLPVVVVATAVVATVAHCENFRDLHFCPFVPFLWDLLSPDKT